jgi:DNA-binding transcriptional LysR family regulator
MELHQLRYAVRVAELRSFTRAAVELHIAQPSLSQQVRKLERELGFALFARGPTGVRLTSEGELFLPHARAVLDRLAQALTAAEEIRGLQRGRVTIGLSPIAGAHILPALLRAIADRFPGLRVETREGGLSRLAELLSTGAVDLALILLPTSDPDLVYTTVLAEDLVLVVPRDHALAATDVVDLAALCDERFVLLTPDYGLRQQIVAACARVGFTPQVVFESHEVGIIQRLVEAGLGVTIIPVSAVRADLATVVRPVLAGGVPPQRAVGLAMRADRYVPLAARRVFALAREVFGGG